MTWQINKCLRLLNKVFFWKLQRLNTVATQNVYYETFTYPICGLSHDLWEILTKLSTSDFYGLLQYLIFKSFRRILYLDVTFLQQTDKEGSNLQTSQSYFWNGQTFPDGFVKREFCYLFLTKRKSISNIRF